MNEHFTDWKKEMNKTEESMVSNAIKMWRKGKAQGSKILIEHLLPTNHEESKEDGQDNRLTKVSTDERPSPPPSEL